MATPGRRRGPEMPLLKTHFVCEFCHERVVKVKAEGEEKALVPGIAVWFITPRLDAQGMSIAVPGSGYVEHRWICGGGKE